MPTKKSAPAPLDSHGGRPLPPPAIDLATRRRHPRLWVARMHNPYSFSPAGVLHGPGVGHEWLPASSADWEPDPIGALNHFTAGCRDPFGTLKERGVGAHLSTLQDLVGVFFVAVRQFVELQNACWHAFGASHHYVGIENTAAPGAGCDFRVRQLNTLAALNAAVLEWIYRERHVFVPTVRSPGVAYRPGLKCHTDGLENAGIWDSSGHWDAPWRATGDPIAKWVSDPERRALDRSPWSSRQFVARVRQFRGK